ncbi:MAG: hypothetical protein ABIM74_07515 [candidate division WOR-3 bacterium]
MEVLGHSRRYAMVRDAVSGVIQCGKLSVITRGLMWLTVSVSVDEEPITSTSGSREALASYHVRHG